jgi:ferredoxin-NADP reductase
MEERDWTHQFGNAPQVYRELQGRIFYIAGPPAMVAAARRTLVKASVDEDDIRTEEFAGY